jgi:hypothetical protein
MEGGDKKKAEALKDASSVARTRETKGLKQAAQGTHKADERR